MRARPGSVDPEGAARLTVSSRVIRLIEGSRQPSGTNVFGSIHVAVVAGLASKAVPRPYRQRLALGDVAAFRATFRRGEPAVDLYDRSTGFLGLILNHADERRPAGIADRPGQLPVLLHSLDA